MLEVVVDTRVTAHCFSHEVVCRFELRHVSMTVKDDAVELFGSCDERLRPAVHRVLTICIRHGLFAFVGTKCVTSWSSPSLHRLHVALAIALLG